MFKCVVAVLNQGYLVIMYDFLKSFFVCTFIVSFLKFKLTLSNIFEESLKGFSKSMLAPELITPLLNSSIKF